jgi:hypothetical protein
LGQEIKSGKEMECLEYLKFEVPKVLVGCGVQRFIRTATFSQVKKLKSIRADFSKSADFEISQIQKFPIDSQRHTK